MVFFRIHEGRRRCLLPLSALVLAAYFFLVLLPLGQRVQKLDQPLGQTGQDLAFALGQQEFQVLDAAAIEDQLRQSEAALAALQATTRRAAERLALNADIHDRMNAPFQLVDFQYERQSVVNHVTQMAETNGVTFHPGVVAGFPQYTADVQHPAVLWAKLEFARHLLIAAVHHRLAAVHSLGTAPAQTNALAFYATRKLVELPLYLEVAGSMANVLRFLRSLPLRADELPASAGAVVPADKPPLFLRRLLILKQSPAKPDEVRLVLHVSGFLLRGQGGLPLDSDP